MSQAPEPGRHDVRLYRCLVAAAFFADVLRAALPHANCRPLRRTQNSPCASGAKDLLFRPEKLATDPGIENLQPSTLPTPHSPHGESSCGEACPRLSAKLCQS